MITNKRDVPQAVQVVKQTGADSNMVYMEPVFKICLHNPVDAEDLQYALNLLLEMCRQGELPGDEPGDEPHYDLTAKGVD